MKREYNPLFGNLFGAKRNPQPEPGKSTQVIISSFSQPNVLQQRMKEGKLTHGETVTANLSPVRLESYPGKMVMYFCPMKSIEVLETVCKGDGGDIPSQAKVEGLAIPDNYKSGFYKLKNVVLTSNGTMQLTATNETAWEFAEMER